MSRKVSETIGKTVNPSQVIKGQLHRILRPFAMI